MRRRQFEVIEHNAFRHHKEAAIARDIVSFLNKDEYLHIVKQPCVYCNAFSIRKNKYTKAELPLNSVDRINNEPYYKIENCQSTCFICQKMKGTLSHEHFLNQIKLIKNKT